MSDSDYFPDESLIDQTDVGTPCLSQSIEETSFSTKKKRQKWTKPKRKGAPKYSAPKDNSKYARVESTIGAHARSTYDVEALQSTYDVESSDFDHSLIHSDDTPTSSQMLTTTPDTCASMKLGNKFDAPKKKEKTTMMISGETRDREVTVSEVSSNLVINFSILQDMLDVCTVCKVCKSGRIVIWDKNRQSCIGRHLLARCDLCGFAKDFWSVSGRFSAKLKVGDFNVTKRNDSVYQSVLGARLIGATWSGLSVYHAMLGIGAYTFLHRETHSDILKVAEYIASESMKIAALEIREKTTPREDNYIHDIGSFDGAYQKRSTKGGGGFSRYCFASVISLTTGKVLAYDIACNSCPKCTNYERMLEEGLFDKSGYDKAVNSHKASCPAKYRDFSSVSLESELAPVILKKALDRGIIFDGIVCDGDNKSFSKVSDINPYSEIAPDHRILRYECLSHVAKRMKAHLIEHQKEKLKDARARKKVETDFLTRTGASREEATKKTGIMFQGQLRRTTQLRGTWGSEATGTSLQPSSSLSISVSKSIKYLSDEMCSRISSFYQLAVKQSIGDAPAILKTVLAIPLHLGANDENAQVNHSLCPQSSTSWCRFSRAVAEGAEPPRHPNFLSKECVELVTSVFDKYNYNKEFFVHQIANGQSSNHNEAIHQILFSMVRKTDAIGFDSMKFGSAIAVIRYNDGYKALLKILECLQVEIHPKLVEVFTKLDKERVDDSYSQLQRIHKRFQSRMKRVRRNAASIRKHGIGYSSGAFAGSSNLNPEIDELGDDSEQFPHNSEISCALCSKNNSEGEIDCINIVVPGEILSWLKCVRCKLLFHSVCLGLDEFQETPVRWSCPACEQLETELPLL